MAKATRTTKGGNIIQVEVVRTVRNKVLWADGWNMPAGREPVEYTTITLLKGNRQIASGHQVGRLHPKNDAAMMAKGAVARIGAAYLPAETVNLIDEALAEAEAAEPGSEEFWALKAIKERAEAENRQRWEEEAPLRREMEEFERRMNDPNSDL